MCSDWSEIQCVVIGRIPQAFDGNVTEILSYRIVMPGRDETKTIKLIINEAFVASSGDIITDYNDLYCLFTHRVASCRINITMSAFVIVETPNKHYSTLLKTRIWIVSGKFFKYENILTGFESEAPAFVDRSSRFRKQSSVKCTTHTLIFGLNCSGTV